MTTPSNTAAPQFGLDYRDSTGALAHITPADIKSFQGGKSFAIEYIGIAQGQGNAALTAANAVALENQGLSIVSVYENRPTSGGMTDTDPHGNYTNSWVSYFSHPGQGTIDAQNAISGATAAGQFTGAIYFAIDLDPAKSTDPTTHQNIISEASALNLIDAYFQQIATYFNDYNQQHGTSYQIGVYGAGDTLTKIANDPLVVADGVHAYTWLAGATAWAGSKTFTGWDIQQYDNDQFQLDGRNVDLDQTSGQPFGAWGISAQTVQNDYLGITRSPLALDQAATVTGAINAGTQTETQYVNGLLSHVANTTIPAVAVEASMYGSVGSSTEITTLTTQFLPSQIAYAMQSGFDPQVFACQQLGLVFAFGNESGSTAFADHFGPSNTAMPATAAGDAAFATAAANAVFGSAQTANTASAILGYVTFLEGFFATHGIVGVQNPTAAQIDLAARAGAWGDAVAIALGDNLGPLAGQTINFLKDAAHGTAVYSAPLSSQPNAAAFLGTASTMTATMAGDTQVIGIALPIDHIHA
jgi:hypothetical protein